MYSYNVCLGYRNIDYDGDSNSCPYAEERPHGEWIPVSERLPDEETDVLICNLNGDVTISRGSYSTEMKDVFIWYTSGWTFGKVIAWMPLPEPYKEAENE